MVISCVRHKVCRLLIVVNNHLELENVCVKFVCLVHFRDGRLEHILPFLRFVAVGTSRVMVFRLPIAMLRLEGRAKTDSAVRRPQWDFT